MATSDSPTRRQLDDLEALMQRMLALPVQPDEEEVPQPALPCFPAEPPPEEQTPPLRQELSLPAQPEPGPSLPIPPAPIRVGAQLAGNAAIGPVASGTTAPEASPGSLVRINQAFDTFAACFGPPGRWLATPPGRALLGGMGILILGGTALWVAVEGLRWTW